MIYQKKILDLKRFSNSLENLGFQKKKNNIIFYVTTRNKS